MTEQEFRELLKKDRDAAATWFAGHRVSEWINDGQEEVERCIACWIGQKLNLGDDELLVEMASPYFADTEEAA